VALGFRGGREQILDIARPPDGARLRFLHNVKNWAMTLLNFASANSPVRRTSFIRRIACSTLFESETSESTGRSLFTSSRQSPISAHTLSSSITSGGFSIEYRKREAIFRIETTMRNAFWNRQI
jgi:hypothetical protein